VTVNPQHSELESLRLENERLRLENAKLKAALETIAYMKVSWVGLIDTARDALRS
jgi:hypothetical protein